MIVSIRRCAAHKAFDVRVKGTAEGEREERVKGWLERNVSYKTETFSPLLSAANNDIA